MNLALNTMFRSLFTYYVNAAQCSRIFNKRHQLDDRPAGRAVLDECTGAPPRLIAASP